MDLEPLVEAARTGDRDAQGALVERHQDLAVALACAWLGDPDRARDVAQEALVDALLHLGQLREARAFPGWLRTVVRKHCDRETRRAAPAPLESAPEPRAGGARADAALAEAERRAWLRASMEALPEHERLALALQAIAGAPVEEIGRFLGVSTGAVKVRLSRARQRLRERRTEPMPERLTDLRPSRSPRFGATVQIFVAIREGDLDSARALLGADPELVDAEEEWSVEAALAGEVPIPTHATPLIRAAERDDVAMIDLLVERGADVNRSCGCAGGESALWAALVTGRPAAVRRLLELGADPEASAHSGNTPLHVAAMRGLASVVPDLLRAGADPGRRSPAGLTAMDWARERGHATVAKLLEGDTHPGAGRTPAARPVAPEGPCLETGIKILDLFAPLAPGDTIVCHAGAGLGRNVLLAEVAERLLRQPRTRVLFAAWAPEPWERAELEQLLAEAGLTGRAELFTSGPDATEACLRGFAPRMAAAAQQALDGDVDHLLLVVFERAGHGAELDAVLPELGIRERGAITTVRVSTLASGTHGAAPKLAPPHDAIWCFDPERARLRLFPALDVRATTSRVAAERPESERRIAEAARALLGAPGPLEDAPLRARQLAAYLTQPFYSMEPFLFRPGSSVPGARMLADVAGILSGALGDLAPERILYRGALEDEPANQAQASR